MLAALERRVDKLVLWLALAGAACLLVVALLTTADVLLRWLFAKPIPGLMDFSALGTAIVVAACFPMLIARRGNVTMRLLGNALGRPVARILDVFGALVTAVFFGLMTWQYVRFTIEAGQAGEASAILRWPVAPWWGTVSALIGVTAAVAIVVLAREIRGRSEGDAPADVNA